MGWNPVSGTFVCASKPLVPRRKIVQRSQVSLPAQPKPKNYTLMPSSRSENLLGSLGLMRSPRVRNLADPSEVERSLHLGLLERDARQHIHIIG